MNDPLIDGRRCTTLIQEVNPDLEINNVQFVNNDLDMDTDFGVLVRCDFCLDNFNSLPDLESHIAKEHYQTELKKTMPFDDDEDYGCPDDYQQVFPIFCKFCQKSFVTENEFQQHNVLEHSNIVEFQDQLPVNEASLQLQKVPWPFLSVLSARPVSPW